MVANMLPAYEAATHDFLWISTSRIAGRCTKHKSGMRSKPNMVSFGFAAQEEALLDMVEKAQNAQTAIVHQMPFVCDDQGFSRAVERVSSVARVSERCVSGVLSSGSGVLRLHAGAFLHLAQRVRVQLFHWDVISSQEVRAGASQGTRTLREVSC